MSACHTVSFYCYSSENAYSNRSLEDLELKILSDSSSCPGANKVRKLFNNRSLGLTLRHLSIFTYITDYKVFLMSES